MEKLKKCNQVYSVENGKLREKLFEGTFKQCWEYRNLIEALEPEKELIIVI